jgi:transposase-like protein
MTPHCYKCGTTENLTKQKIRNGIRSYRCTDCNRIQRQKTMMSDFVYKSPEYLEWERKSNESIKRITARFTNA